MDQRITPQDRRASVILVSNLQSAILTAMAVQLQAIQLVLRVPLGST